MLDSSKENLKMDAMKRVISVSLFFNVVNVKLTLLKLLYLLKIVQRLV